MNRAEPAVVAAPSPARERGREVDDAFAAVYRREFPQLAGFCARLTGDEEAGRDIAQEALVRLLSRFSSVRDPRAWLFLVATNLVRDRWKRAATGAVALRRHAASDQREAPAADPALADAVSRLPRRLQGPVVLHYLLDMRVEDCAATLNVPVGTVKRRLHEARAVLAEALGDHRDE